MPDASPPPSPVGLRRVVALLLGCAAGTIALITVMPDPDPGDHAPLLVLSGVSALLALGLELWPRPPRALEHALIPIGTVLVSAVVAVCQPVALAPMFYVWPALAAAYFLPRREVVANGVLALGAYALVEVLWVEPGVRAVSLLAVASLLGTVTVVVLELRSRLESTVAVLRRDASEDPLTGALNRRAFDEALGRAVGTHRRTGRTSALIVLDVDHFKAVNDRLGHDGGDDVLRRLAATVQRLRRGTDTFARIGGEEFAVLLDDTDAAGGERFARRLRRTLLEDGPTAGRHVTVSAGVATVGRWIDASATLAAADRALYAAKAAGRDRAFVAEEPAAPTAGRAPAAA